MARTELSTDDLQLGDVLFYKTTRDLDADGVPGFENLTALDLEEQFAALAAFVQGLPYHIRRNEHRPWYHVGVYVGDGKVVGFDYHISEGKLDNTSLARLDLDVGKLAEDEVEVEVLRPPERYRSIGVTTADAIGQQSLALALTEASYSIEGLLGFALASLGWMTPVSAARAQYLLEARGANELAKELATAGESCVTAVAKVIALALGRELVFEEPPALPCDFALSLAGGGNRAEIAASTAETIDTALKQMVDRIVNGQLNKPEIGGPIEPRIARGRVAAHAVQEMELTSTRVVGSWSETFGMHDAVGIADPALVHRLSLDRLGELGLVDEFRRLVAGYQQFVDDWLRMGFQEVITATLAALFYETGIEMVLTDKTWADVVAAGQKACGALKSDDYLVSPAMLWDALQLECFTEVGVLRAPLETS